MEFERVLKELLEASRREQAAPPNTWEALREGFEVQRAKVKLRRYVRKLEELVLDKAYETIAAAESVSDPVADPVAESVSESVNYIFELITESWEDVPLEIWPDYAVAAQEYLEGKNGG